MSNCRMSTSDVAGNPYCCQGSKYNYKPTYTLEAEKIITDIIAVHINISPFVYTCRGDHGFILPFNYTLKIY